MTERRDLLASIAGTIKDYRAGEIAEPTPQHVDRWVSQFGSEAQVPLLREMDYVLKRTYRSRERVTGLLTTLAKHPPEPRHKVSLLILGTSTHFRHSAERRQPDRNQESIRRYLALCLRVEYGGKSHQMDALLSIWTMLCLAAIASSAICQTGCRPRLKKRRCTFVSLLVTLEGNIGARAGLSKLPATPARTLTCDFGVSLATKAASIIVISPTCFGRQLMFMPARAFSRANPVTGQTVFSAANRGDSCLSANF